MSKQLINSFKRNCPIVEVVVKDDYPKSLFARACIVPQSRIFMYSKFHLFTIQVKLDTAVKRFKTTLNK